MPDNPNHNHKPDPTATRAERPLAWDPTPMLAWEMPGNIFTRFLLTCWQVMLYPSYSFIKPGVRGYLRPFLFALIPYMLIMVLGLADDLISETPTVTPPEAQLSIPQDAERPTRVWSKLNTPPDAKISTEVWFNLDVASLFFKDYTYIRIFNFPFAPLDLAITLLLFTVPLHLFLRLFRFAGRPLQATYKAVTYCIGIHFLLFLIPLFFMKYFNKPFGTAQIEGWAVLVEFISILGTGLGAVIWTLVITLKGLAAIHQTSTAKVFLAGFSCLVVTILYLFLIYMPLIDWVIKP